MSLAVREPGRPQSGPAALVLTGPEGVGGLFQGERLSHAVGCAFAACLERKQKREKECGVTATFDANRTTFTREGSFRVTTATEAAEREEVMRQLQDVKKGQCV